jgi:hypothetical protein
MTQVHTDLIAAKALITDIKRWTTEAVARDYDRHGVPAHSANAVCWCAFGALQRAVRGEQETNLHPDEFVNFEREDNLWLALVRGGVSIDSRGPIFLNDNSSHDVVMQMFDAAIAMEA